MRPPVAEVIRTMRLAGAAGGVLPVPLSVRFRPGPHFVFEFRCMYADAHQALVRCDMSVNGALSVRSQSSTASSKCSPSCPGRRRMFPTVVTRDATAIRVFTANELMSMLDKLGARCSEDSMPLSYQKRQFNIISDPSKCIHHVSSSSPVHGKNRVLC